VAGVLKAAKYNFIEVQKWNHRWLIILMDDKQVCKPIGAEMNFMARDHRALHRNAVTWSERHSWV
jgi:hypothetical protein